MAKITLNKEECIGCGSCAALCPDFWEMPAEAGAEMKVNFKGSKRNEASGEWELEANEVGCNQDAVDCCPVQVIKIVAND